MPPVYSDHPCPHRLNLPPAIQLLTLALLNYRTSKFAPGKESHPSQRHHNWRPPSPPAGRCSATMAASHVHSSSCKSKPDSRTNRETCPVPAKIFNKCWMYTSAKAD